MVTPEMVLSRLPPSLGEYQLIKERQFVPDIVTEVRKSHRMFGSFYDQFSDLFYNRNAGVVADNLYDFCKKYLHYKEQPKEWQSSLMPQGIIELGYQGSGVDCKHYSLFCAGVLGSLNRLYDCCFEGYFYFVGYDGAREPYHVYVTVMDATCEIWIDPTPGSGGKPSLIIPKPL
jgi:hypothetical protein